MGGDPDMVSGRVLPEGCGHSSGHCCSSLETGGCTRQCGLVKRQYRSSVIGVYSLLACHSGGAFREGCGAPSGISCQQDRELPVFLSKTNQRLNGGARHKRKGFGPPVEAMPKGVPEAGAMVIKPSRKGEGAALRSARTTASPTFCHLADAWLGH